MAPIDVGDVVPEGTISFIDVKVLSSRPSPFTLSPRKFSFISGSDYWFQYKYSFGIGLKLALSEILKLYITQDGVRSQLPSKPKYKPVPNATLQVPGVVGWRREGLAYKKNEFHGKH